MTLGLEVEVRQTNHEGELLDWLNAAADDADPGRAQRRCLDPLLLALYDACAQLTAPLVEVHISDPSRGRRSSATTPWSRRTPPQVIAGQGIDGYRRLSRSSRRVTQKSPWRSEVTKAGRH